MKNQKRKVTQTNIVETVDIRTGEIELNTVQSQSFLIDREPDYVKLYLADVTRLKDIVKATSYKKYILTLYIIEIIMNQVAVVLLTGL